MNRFAKLSLCVVLLSVCVAAQSLNGAGATFPNPIYSKWFSEYHKANPKVQINYQPIGSGGGIRQLLEGTVDFGATDGPMTDEQLTQAKAKVLHVPTVLGAVVAAYNLPGVTQDLKFTPAVLADIYLGKITKWNDPALVKINPGVNLPNQQIVVAHRSDGSGTTYCFTDYLSKVSPEWAQKVGRNTSVKWPVGNGGKGNEGVAGLVRQLPGSIGYIELIYALQTKIAYGAVQNAAGNFVKASLESTSAAAAGTKMPADFRVSITNAGGKNAYPIATFTWLLIPVQSTDPAKGKVLKDFVTWMLDKGEPMASSLEYAPLPNGVAKMVRKEIQQVR